MWDDGFSMDAGSGPYASASAYLSAWFVSSLFCSSSTSSVGLTISFAVWDENDGESLLMTAGIKIGRRSEPGVEIEITASSSTVLPSPWMEQMRTDTKAEANRGEEKEKKRLNEGKTIARRGGGFTFVKTVK